MPHPVNSVLIEIRSMTMLSNIPSPQLDVTARQREHWPVALKLLDNAKSE
jgi:hypothetical protein